MHIGPGIQSGQARPRMWLSFNRKTAARTLWLRPTIRMKIACAFLAITSITLGLGLFASYSIGIAETLVVRTFDNALMSINYARASATDFANMQSVVAGRRYFGAVNDWN